MNQLCYFAIDETDFDAAGFETGGIEIESELIQYDHYDEDDQPVRFRTDPASAMTQPVVAPSPTIRQPPAWCMSPWQLSHTASPGLSVPVGTASVALAHLRSQ